MATEEKLEDLKFDPAYLEEFGVNQDFTLKEGFKFPKELNESWDDITFEGFNEVEADIDQAYKDLAKEKYILETLQTIRYTYSIYERVPGMYDNPGPFNLERLEWDIKKQLIVVASIEKGIADYLADDGEEKEEEEEEEELTFPSDEEISQVVIEDDEKALAAAKAIVAEADSTDEPLFGFAQFYKELVDNYGESGRVLKTKAYQDYMEWVNSLQVEKYGMAVEKYGPYRFYEEMDRYASQVKIQGARYYKLS